MTSTPPLDTTPSGAPNPVRRGSPRDRRGRGMRGPAVLPGRWSPTGVPAVRSAKDTFDALVLRMVGELNGRWHEELGLVEFGVEETPLVPDDWESSTVPLSSMVRGTKGEPSRIVLFRRPIELRCENQAELRALLLTVLVEQVSELVSRPPSEIDPRYDDD